ncbi:hypothetical protein [Paenibacillus jiagnxiensis]|uniref:hypothetical protein n=1 Tax=Paenibacillus jiagnxiensis TaxID=3228926 RepID=UPI0033AC4B43
MKIIITVNLNFALAKNFIFLIDTPMKSGIISNRNRTLFCHWGGMPWIAGVISRLPDRLIA